MEIMNVKILTEVVASSPVGENSLRKLFTSLGFRRGAAAVRTQVAADLHELSRNSGDINFDFQADYHAERANTILHGSSTSVMTLFLGWEKEFTTHVRAALSKTNNP